MTEPDGEGLEPVPDAAPQLPDLSPTQPPARPKPGRHTGRMKGRHFGPRPVADPRTKRLDLRVTLAQREAMRAAAQEAGLSVSAFICLRALGTEGPRAHRSRPDLDTAWKAQMLAAMGRSGNNLNQLLRRVNSYDFRGQPELLEMRAAMKAAHATHRELCEAIMVQLGV